MRKKTVAKKYIELVFIINGGGDTYILYIVFMKLICARNHYIFISAT